MNDLEGPAVAVTGGSGGVGAALGAAARRDAQPAVLEVGTATAPEPAPALLCELLTLPSVRRREQDHPGVVVRREFRSRLDDGRAATLGRFDEHRRAALRAERVPDDLVDPVPRLRRQVSDDGR